MKYRLRYLVVLFIFFLPALGTAQTFTPLPDRPVWVMPFTGESAGANRRFRETVTAEIRSIPGNFDPDPLDPPLEEAERLVPDEPPPAHLTGDREFAVTGAAFFDDWEHHLQVWLWDLTEPTLIYTDELVCVDVAEADEYITLLVDWIFSHVPGLEEEEGEAEDYSPYLAEESAPVEPSAAPPEQPAPLPPAEEGYHWFQAGGRLGGSIRHYVIPAGETASVPYTAQQALLSPSFEAALQGSVQVLPFLAIQGEVVFTMDFASFPAYDYQPDNPNKDTIVESTARLQYMSLMFPLLIKFTYSPGPFLIAPYGGAALLLPLGDLAITSPWETYQSGAVSYRRDLPLAWIGGISLGMKMSQFKKGLPGRLFADVRFTADLGTTNFDRPADHAASFLDPFKRNMLTLSVGYEIGLLARK